MRWISLLLLIVISATLMFGTITTYKYQGTTTDTLSLASLGIGAARQSTKVDNKAAGDVEDQVYIVYKTGSAPNSQGSISVFFYSCRDSNTANCIDSGEITGSDSPVTLPSQNTLPLGTGPSGPVTCWASVATTVYTCGPFSLVQTFGSAPPAGWGVVVVNNSGQALDSLCAACGMWHDRFAYQNQ